MAYTGTRHICGRHYADKNTSKHLKGINKGVIRVCYAGNQRHTAPTTQISKSLTLKSQCPNAKPADLLISKSHLTSLIFIVLSCQTSVGIVFSRYLCEKEVTALTTLYQLTAVSNSWKGSSIRTSSPISYITPQLSQVCYIVSIGTAHTHTLCKESGV